MTQPEQNAQTTLKVGDFVVMTEMHPHFTGRRCLVTETHLQHVTNGFRRVTVTALRDANHARHDGICVPNEYVVAEEAVVA